MSSRRAPSSDTGGGRAAWPPSRIRRSECTRANDTATNRHPPSDTRLVLATIPTPTVLTLTLTGLPSGSTVTSRRVTCSVRATASSAAAAGRRGTCSRRTGAPSSVTAGTLRSSAHASPLSSHVSRANAPRSRHASRRMRCATPAAGRRWMRGGRVLGSRWRTRSIGALPTCLGRWALPHLALALT